MIFESKISYLSKWFSSKFLKSFWAKRFIFYLFSRVRKIKEKYSIWDNSFDLHFYLLLVFFSSIFLCDLFSKHLIFSHLSYHLYPIYRILFLWKIFCRLWWSPSCNLSLLLALCFTSCVEVAVFEWSSLLWLCAYPSCVEVIVEEFGFVSIPLSVEVIVVGVLALCLSL